MRTSTMLILILLFAMCASFCPEAGAERATPEEMERVCENWLAYMVHEKGDWAAYAEPEIAGVQNLTAEGILLARCYSIHPKGHIVVPVLKELPPIKAHSDECNLDAGEERGMAQLLRDVLGPQTRLFESLYGSVDASQPVSGDVAFDRGNLDRWSRLSVDPQEFRADLRRKGRTSRDEVGPLLTTAWHQGDPYNQRCPLGDTTCVMCPRGNDPELPTVVGCVATALAQVMNYHEWPLYGVGGSIYSWRGDGSCNNWPPLGATPLVGRYSDEYDWARMPDSCVAGCALGQEWAVAELCSEVGVALAMDYGVCESRSLFSRVVDVLPLYFRYDPSITLENRSSYGDFPWWLMIVNEINAGRPVLYSLIPPNLGDPHAVVVDGWTDDPANIEPYQYGVHMNFGWGWIEDGRWMGWYALDAPNPPNPWPPEWPGMVKPTEELIRYIMPKPFSVHRVNAGGTGDFATIQAAINGAQAGDVILLADGVYTGVGNRDLDFGGKALTIRSEGEDPTTCVIDCQGGGRGLYFHSGETPGCVLEGVTIRNGYEAEGGAVWIGVIPPVEISPVFLNCVFSGNSAGRGGAIFSFATRVTLIDCVFSGNSAVGDTRSGGALYCDGYSPKLAHCTFSGNTATGSMSVCYGGGVYCTGATPVLSHCTFSDNRAEGLFGYGGGLYCGHSTATLAECVFSGNSAAALMGSSRGGAMYCTGDSSASMSRCTIVGNSASTGGGVACDQGYALNAQTTIIAYSTQGEAVCCDGTSSATLACCDVYGNSGGTGDWIGCLAGQDGINGNFCDDPRFCDLAGGDYHIEEDSPCAPGYHPDGYACGLIGTRGAGCDWAPVSEEAIPAEAVALHLWPNTPNPFNPSTEISYLIPAGARPCRVSLVVYNCLGQRVRTLVDQTVSTGTHSVHWDGTDHNGVGVASGVYFAHLRWKGEARTQRMVMLK